MAIKKRMLSVERAKIPKAMVISPGIMNQDLTFFFLGNSNAFHSSS